jgi:flavin reductase (DIM6/NTAB) family NADH-FMN oxidoreductase RutF
MKISSEELKQLDKRYRTTLINSLPGYKCLHLVGTLNENGHSNLGLFNSIFHLGASPALLGMVFRPQSEDHDTLNNIKRNGFYTFNNVLPTYYKKAHHTSARFPSGVSEFEECGLTEFFLPDFDAPFVAESSVKIALELKQVLPVALNDTTIVIGEVKYILLAPNLVAKDGYVDHQAAQTLTVAGLDSYFEANAIGRLSYAKPEATPSSLS